MSGSPSPIKGYFGSLVKTKIGTLALIWNSDQKIVALQLPESSDANLKKKMEAKFPDLIWKKRDLPGKVANLIQDIQKHFQGKPLHFPFDYLESSRMSPFFRKVYESAHRIPSGTVVTYQDLAKKAGSPKASRAVGQAMARNPLPLLIPCHRVVGHNKKLVGFSAYGGVSTKEQLLALESKLHAKRT